MLDHWKPLLAIIVCCFGVAGMLSGRPIERAPGVLAPDEPLQTPTTAAPFSVGEFQVAPQANYDITARVLSVETYRVDGGARLSPIDFAVGWGPMSDSAVLDHFRITQGSRFFTIYPDEAAIDLATALKGAANMHLIPGSARVRDQLDSVRAGNVVRLQGYLVNVSRADGYTWNTSLTRNDTGAGACELFYVEDVAVR
ncbi:MAG TPA: hypothetical protein PKE27_09930 [Povalibacter sp.]|uniref:hypothetical protein n=1 Tax=Povalibacter sp. TaxID=1962978 RepID=UPI002C2AB963|nr:hypothetical protein [Povalibacter sp.]HMN44882.1 hypothetical protein [Povalibacter sp.]